MAAPLALALLLAGTPGLAPDTLASPAAATSTPTSTSTSTPTSTSTSTPTSTATSTPTATPTATSTPTPALSLPSTPAPGLSSLAIPVAALALLAVAALALARRRAAAPRLVQVLESTSLGQRRALVVARLGDELLVLGASEAGVSLLATRPAGLHAEAAALATLVPAPAPSPGPLSGLLARLRPTAARPAAGGFDALLAESDEDQELRAKLARGLTGSVR
jgi:MYXO-CTERM domain-containing protein